MFDIGFSEVVVIAVVALIVIGPERLPRVARTLGLLFGRAQRYVNDVKTDIAHQLELDELKQARGDAGQALRAVEQAVAREISAAGTLAESARPAAEVATVVPPAPSVGGNGERPQG